MNEAQAPGPARIGRQMVLPWRKAIEIAIKSIKVRFWRSMITMSSIILAIAFLMSIWTSTAITTALALGPQNDIDSLRQRIATVRTTLDAAQGAPSPQDLQTRLASDLEIARQHAQDQIDEATEAIEDATSEEKKTLETTIADLKARLAPDKAVQLLHDDLTERKRQLELLKGEVDAVLQQERVAGEPQGAAPKTADKPAEPKVAGGAVTTFLSHMSATDKWLAILALLVCFVGIVNAMFMTVQERFREIGTMKCLGALDSFIVKIFLIESATLGFIGTLFGIAVGLLLSTIRQALVYGTPTFTYFPPGSILLAVLMAAFVGLVLSILAALFPARNAARMEPVEAMRIEE